MLSIKGVVQSIQDHLRSNDRRGRMRAKLETRTKTPGHTAKPFVVSRIYELV